MAPTLVTTDSTIGRDLRATLNRQRGVPAGLTWGEFKAALVLLGEKVPDYLARIVQDKGARRRFALALLEDDTDVIVTTTITIPQIKKVG